MIISFLKKCLIFALFILQGINLFSQAPLSAEINIFPPFSTQFNTWAADISNYIITINNQSNTSFDYYIRMSIEGQAGNESTFIRTSSNYFPSEPLTIEPYSVNVLTSDDLESVFSNISTSDLDKSPNIAFNIDGELPEGNYQICIELLRYTPLEDIFLSPKICSEEFDVGHGTIQLIIPDNESIIEEDLPINFNWITTSSNLLNGDYSYALRLYELDPLMQAEESVYEYIESGADPFFYADEIFELSYFYDIELGLPALTAGNLYAAQVEIISPGGTFFDNNNVSNINTFWYGNRPDEVDDNTINNDVSELECEERCNLIVLENNSLITNITSINHFKLSHFAVNDILINQQTGNSISGTGKIQLTFLNNITIPIEFTDIVINSDQEAIEGTARAVHDNIPGLTEIIDEANLGLLDPLTSYGTDAIGNALTADQSNAIANGIRNGRMLETLATQGEIGLPLGINQTLSGTEIILGIMDIVFTTQGAKAQIMAGYFMPCLNQENWVLFEGKGVCMHPQGFGGEFTFQLGADLHIGNSSASTYELILEGGNNPNPETTGQQKSFIKMTCDGLEELNISGHVLFNRNHLLPDERGEIMANGQVRGDFNINLKKNRNEVDEATSSDLIVGLDITPFQFKGLKGWTFNANEAYIDMSDLENPDGMIFPELYGSSDGGSPVFKGFYMKELTIAAPKKMTKGDRRPKVAVQNLIIEPNIYFQANAQDLIRAGAIEGWAFSMDTLYLEIYNNQLRSGGFAGKIGLPITKGNDLDYEAVINTDLTATENGGSVDHYSYDFTVTTLRDIKMPMFIATATLYGNSSVSIHSDPANGDRFSLESSLHGLLSISTENLRPQAKNELPVSLTFTEMSFDIDYNSADGFNESSTNFAFASPQKYISGFPLTLEDFEIEATGQEVSLSANAPIDLVGESNAIECTTHFGIHSALNILDGRRALKKFRFTGINVDAITIDADFSGFHLDGSLEFYNKPLESGRDKGLIGSLEVKMPVPIILDLEAQFGSIRPDVLLDSNTSSSATNFNYFRIQAELVSESPIIAMGPLDIYKFKGGIFYNMAKENNSQTNEDIYSPAYRTRGFEAGITVGLAKNPSTFNGDLTLGMFFNTSNGTGEFRLEGDAYFMTPMDERDDFSFYLSMDLAVLKDPEQISITGDFDFFANYTPSGLSIIGNMEGDVQPFQAIQGRLLIQKEEWYFHMGKPARNKRGSMHINIASVADFDLETYFMVGYGIPAHLPPIPPKIMNIIGGNDVDADTPGMDEATRNLNVTDAESGQGIAHGAYIEASIDFNAFLLRASLFAGIGYDLNLSHNTDIQCGEMLRGVNGWYAQAQAYAGIKGKIALGFKLFGKEVEAPIGQLAIGATLEAGLPRPIYFEGNLGIHFNVLGGLVKGDATVKLNLGKRCRDIPNSPLGVPIIDNSYPEDEGQMEVYKDAKIAFTFPINKRFELPEGMEGKTRWYEIKLSDSKIKFKRKNTSIDVEKNWSNDGKILSLDISSDGLDERKPHSISMNFTFIKYKKNGVGIEDKKPFPETINFTTGRAPTTLDPFVEFTAPSKGENFFCKNDDKFIILTADNEDYAEENLLYTEKDGTQYEYKTRLLCLETQEVSYQNFIYQHNAYRIDLDNLNLDKNKTYTFEIIRKTIIENPMLIGGLNIGSPIYNFIPISINNDGDLSISTEASIRKTRLDALVYNSAYGEFTVFKTYFKTGKFDRLVDKLNTITCSKAADYNNLYRNDVFAYKINIEERFDHFYLRSFNLYNDENKKNHSMISLWADGITNTDVNQNRTLVHNFIDQLPYFTNTSDLNLQWSSVIPYSSNANIISGNFLQPFSLEERVEQLSEPFSSFTFGRDPDLQALLIPSNSNLGFRGYNYTVKNKLYKKMVADRQSLLDKYNYLVSHAAHNNANYRYTVPFQLDHAFVQLRNANFSLSTAQENEIWFIMNKSKYPISDDIPVHMINQVQTLQASEILKLVNTIPYTIITIPNSVGLGLWVN